MRELSGEKILELTTSYRQSRVLLTGIELGIFDVLSDSGKTSAEVAKELGLNSRAADRLMNALCALGVLKKEKGLFSNTENAGHMLCRESPGFLPGLHHSNHLWKSWSQLSEVVRSGRPADVPERNSPEWTKAFISAMEGFAKMRASAVLDEIDLSGVSSVLDAGGGSGAYALEIAKRLPDARCVVFDLPAVTVLTRGYIEKTPFKEQVTTVDGDYLVDEFPEGFDLVLLSNIIHSLSPGETKELFRKCRKSLRARGRVMIQEFVPDEDRTSPPGPVFFALNMLVNTPGGDTYTGEEIRSWLEEAGFADIVRKDTSVDTTLILARKP